MLLRLRRRFVRRPIVLDNEIRGHRQLAGGGRITWQNLPKLSVIGVGDDRRLEPMRSSVMKSQSGMDRAQRQDIGVGCGQSLGNLVAGANLHR